MAERDVDIARLFEPGAEKALDAYLRLLHPADIAELFNYVEEELWPRVTAKLTPEILADVIADLDEVQRGRLGERLQTDRLITVLDELETDDAADVLADLPEDKSEIILGALEDQAAIRVLLAYPEDSAGGIMQTELCRVPTGRCVSDAIEAVRKARDAVDDVLEVYLVSPGGHLVGTVALEDLLVSDAQTPVNDLCRPVEHILTPDTDQERVAQVFRKYDVATLPVVSADGVLLGRITFDDVHDVIEEEASEDIMAMAGASPEELVYGTEFVRIAAFRLPWLLSSLCGSLLTGYLLSLFKHVPGDAIVLASFVPVVMAMTGNLGSQSAMIVTRGLAIGKIELSTVGRTFVREVSVGFIMGLVAGVCVGVVAHLWRGDIRLGIAVTLSMVSSMGVASFVGVAAPTLFKRIGVDPAIAAGPLVTTGCDLLGVTIYLLVAIVTLA